MLVTHTVREIVPMLPRLRIVAVSMQCLEVRHACISAIAIDMINFNPIVIVEEQPTVQTSPELTLLVNSKIWWKAVLHTTFEVQRGRIHSPGKTHSYGVGDWPLRINQQSQNFRYVYGLVSRP
jgi:hypothetical protein